jgi:AcrR family transcriptional regulator
MSGHPPSALDAALQAGAELIAELGPAPRVTTPIAELCREAGVGVGVFYRLFGSAAGFRQEVAEALIARPAVDAYDFPDTVAAAADPTGASFADTVAALAAGYEQQQIADPDVHRDIAAFAWIDDPTVRAVLTTSLDAFHDRQVGIFAAFFAAYGRRPRKGTDIDRILRTLALFAIGGSMDHIRRDGQLPTGDDGTSSFVELLVAATDTFLEEQPRRRRR